MPAEALRPMRLGELLDRTFGLYRRHFRLFTGIMVAPALVMAAFGILMQAMQEPTLAAQASRQPPSPAQIIEAMSRIGPVVILVTGIYGIFITLAQAATVFAMSQVFFGRPATIGGVYRAARARFWRMTGLFLVLLLRIFLYFILATVLVGFFAALLVAVNKTAAILFVWPAIVAIGVLCAFLVIRYCLALPVLLLEDAPITGAIRRAVSLVRGHRFRAFLVFLTMTVVAYAGILLFSAPFTMAQFYLIAKGTFPPLWLRATGAVVGGLSQILTLPLGIIAFVVLYIDIRVRKEALDLQLMIGSLGAPAGPPGEEAAAPPIVPPSGVPPPPATAPGGLGP